MITPREKSVLQLIASGFSTKEIASQLGISFHTAETHRKSLRMKFDVRNSAQLVSKARDQATLAT